MPGKVRIVLAWHHKPMCLVILIPPLAGLMKDPGTYPKNATEEKRKIYHFEILHGQILFIGSG